MVQGSSLLPPCLPWPLAWRDKFFKTLTSITNLEGRSIKELDHNDIFHVSNLLLPSPFKGEGGKVGRRPTMCQFHLSQGANKVSDASPLLIPNWPNHWGSKKIPNLITKNGMQGQQRLQGSSSQPKQRTCEEGKRQEQQQQDVGKQPNQWKDLALTLADVRLEQKESLKKEHRDSRSLSDFGSRFLLPLVFNFWTLDH